MQALQAGLAAEHAVIWGYGGGRRARRRRAAGPGPRRRRRPPHAAGTTTVALVARYGGAPVATEPEYALPFPVTDRGSALRLAVHLEEGAAAAWRYAVAATDDVDVRRTALFALSDAAVRATRWRLALHTRPRDRRVPRRLSAAPPPPWGMPSRRRRTSLR